MSKWIPYIGCLVIEIVCAIQSWVYYYAHNVLGVIFCEVLVMVFGVLSVYEITSIVKEKTEIKKAREELKDVGIDPGMMPR